VFKRKNRIREGDAIGSNEFSYEHERFEVSLEYKIELLNR
jgi:hypothetical protein